MGYAWLRWKLWSQLLSPTFGKRRNFSSLLNRTTNISDRFVHERGFRTAIFNLGVLGGINLAVPIGKSPCHSVAHRLTKELTAAAIIQYSSYHEALYGMGGAFALAFILVFFWMPESAFKREALNIDTGENQVSYRKAQDTISLTCIRSLWKEKQA